MLFPRPSVALASTPPLLWPDIDLYFHGDTGVADALLDAVQTAGCEWVKGAVIQRVDLCLDDESTEQYFVPGRGMVSERYRDILARHVCPLPVLERLYARAVDSGLRVALTVYDEEGLRFAVDVGASALKMASSNVVHAPLIRAAAATGLPLVLDTGKSTMTEVARAVQWARDAGADDLLVQHSPEAPPAPLSRHGLRFMPSLGTAFDCAVGLSDHHAGPEMLYAAVALSATVLEKAVRPDDAHGDIDLAHALPISALPQVVQTCSDIWEALGPPHRHLPVDRPGPAARMGLVTRRAVRAGERVELATVDFAWPARGVPVEHFDDVSGWVFSGDLPARVPVGWSSVHAAD